MKSKSPALAALLGFAAMAQGVSYGGEGLGRTPTTPIKRQVKCPNPDQRNYAKGMKHGSAEFEYKAHGYTYTCVIHASGGTEKSMRKNFERIDKMLEHWIALNTHENIAATGYFEFSELTLNTKQ